MMEKDHNTSDVQNLEEKEERGSKGIDTVYMLAFYGSCRIRY